MIINVVTRGRGASAHKESSGSTDRKESVSHAVSVSVHSPMSGMVSVSVSGVLFSLVTNTTQDLITKWSVPTVRWLSLCAPAPPSHGGRAGFQSTLKPPSSWASHKCRSMLLRGGTSGASESLLQGLCERRKVTFSLHHKAYTLA